MQTTKKLVLIVLVLGTVFGVTFAIAPESMTSLSTEGLFTTDVDDFLNVNEYANVMPSKIFGFLGYGDDGESHIQLGFATQLKSIYIAGFFGGMPVVWSSETDTDNNGKKKTTIGTKDPVSGTYAPISAGTFLVGFKNMGISGSFTFEPRAGNKREIDEAGNTDNTYAKFNTNAALSFGININGPKNILFKNNARLSLQSYVDKETEINKNLNQHTIVNNNIHDLKIGAGTSFDYAQKGAVTQNLAVDLDSSWRIWPAEDEKRTNGNNTTVIKTVGRLDDTITLTPAWTIAYEPEGKFAFRAKAACDTSFSWINDLDYTEEITNSGKTKSYVTSSSPTSYDRKQRFNLNFRPSLDAAMTWQPISKLRFNFGASFNVPPFGWRTTKTAQRDINGNVSGTVKNVTWTFSDYVFPASGKFMASSGLTWFVTDKVTVDGSWNIAKNLLDNKFKTQLTEGDGISVWGTVNKLLVHNVSFLVSFKL